MSGTGMRHNSIDILQLGGRIRFADGPKMALLWIILGILKVIICVRTLLIDLPPLSR